MHLGEKLKYAQDWYEVLLLKEAAIKRLEYENAAKSVDRERQLKSDNSDVHQVVLEDLESVNGKNEFDRVHKNSEALLSLIRHYEENRNDRLNQILGNY